MRPADELLRRGMQPWLAPYAGWLIEVAQLNGLSPRVTSVYRSSTRQAQLYQQWLEGKNKYPVARPGTSYHEYGRAMDLVVARGAAELGALWQRIGGRYGGTADPIHYQA